MNYQDFISHVLKDVSEIARSQYGKVSGSIKDTDHNQVLTETDLAIGSAVISEIKQRFPKHNIIDEEAGVTDHNSEFTWVIDPIDGTSNFALGLPHYGIMIGLLQGEYAYAGGIALPFFNEIYTAEHGQGAYMNGTKMHVSDESELLNSLIAYTIDGHPEDSHRSHEEGKLIGELVMKIRNLRASGSAYDYAMLIQGKYGGYLNKTSKIWDNVAPHILVAEAGGVYTDFWGKPMDYSNPLEKVDQNYTFCAASPLLHNQLQEIIHSI